MFTYRCGADAHKTWHNSNDDHLAEAEVLAGEIGVENHRQRVVDGRAIHVHCGAQGQDERGYILTNSVFVNIFSENIRIKSFLYLQHMQRIPLDDRPY